MRSHLNNQISIGEKDNWDDFRFFLATAEGGNFSAAARLLSVSQPTVSRRIAQFEQRLGIRLFDQHPEGHTLTREAEALLDSANRVRNQINEFRRRAVSLQSNLSGVINLATAESIAQYWLAHIIEQFQTEYPEISINLLSDADKFDLLRNEADIALKFGEPSHKELVGRRIGIVEFALFASKEYLHRFGAPTQISDLYSHSIVGTLKPLYSLPMDSPLSQYLSDSNVTIASNKLNIQLALTKSGQGISCLPHFIADENNLVSVLAADFCHDMDLWLLTHKDLKNTPRIRVLIDFLYRAFKKDMSRFMPSEKQPDT